MKCALLHFRGLFDSDPNGSWCGARMFCEALATKYGLDLTSGNWDDRTANSSLDKLVAEGYDWIAITGHSHGAWRVGEIAKQYQPGDIDFVGLIDYCPFLNPFAQMGPPLLFPTAARYGYGVWQHNSIPTGCKFNANQNIVCVDATGWRDPKVGHVDFPIFGLASIAGDSRVWMIGDPLNPPSIESQLVRALATRTLGVKK